MIRLALALVFCLASIGCGDESSPRCRDACERADECAESAQDPNYKFDKGECKAACSFLEKDAKGTKLVKSYVECLKTATDCAAVNACE